MAALKSYTEAKKKQEAMEILWDYIYYFFVIALFIGAIVFLAYIKVLDGNA